MNSSVRSAVENALAFVEIHGVVLVSARGPAPRLIEAIAGEDILGNWWSHPRANMIYNTLSHVQKSEQLLVCRLVNGKVTLVHRRLWPALAHLAPRFEPQQIARVTEEHTASGRHVASKMLFPEWAPPEVLQQANAMGESDAIALVGRWLPALPGRDKQGRKGR